MSNNKSIQFLRGSAENIAASTEKLLDGQPLYNEDKNYLTIGGGGQKQVNASPIACRELVVYSGDSDTNIGSNLTEMASIKGNPSVGVLTIQSVGTINLSPGTNVQANKGLVVPSGNITAISGNILDHNVRVYSPVNPQPTLYEFVKSYAINSTLKINVGSYDEVVLTCPKSSQYCIAAVLSGVTGKLGQPTHPGSSNWIIDPTTASNFTLMKQTDSGWDTSLQYHASFSKLVVQNVGSSNYLLTWLASSVAGAGYYKLYLDSINFSRVSIVNKLGRDNLAVWGRRNSQ